VAVGCADPARELAKKYPVDPVVEAAQRDVLALVEESRRRAELEKEHKAWVQTRATHCATLAKTGGSGKDADEALEGCFTSFDRQRLLGLGGLRLAMLARQPPPAPARNMPNLPIAFAATRRAEVLAVSPDGRVAAVGLTEGGVDLYDLVSAQKLRTLPADQGAGRLSFSPNGRLIATASRLMRGTKIWDVYSGTLLREYGGSMGPVAMLADGRHMLHADGEKLVVYDYLADKPLPTTYELRESITRFAFSPDRALVATISLRGTVTLWQLTQGPGLLQVAESRDAQTASHSGGKLAFSARGDTLYSVVEGTLHAWSVPELKRERIWPIGGQAIYDVLAPQADPERLVLAGYRPGRGGHIVFLDPKTDTAKLVDLDRGGYTLLGGVPGSDHLLVATSRDLRRVEIPLTEFQPFIEVATQLAPTTPGAASVAQAPVHLPVLRAIAKDAVVEAIGVYQAGAERGTPPREFRERPVSVAVGRTATPIVLVLASYEPVNWRLVHDSSTVVRHILLAGPPQSLVQGAPDVEVTRMGSAYAHEFDKLEQAVAQYLGKGFDRFQYSYDGAQFSIGADEPQLGSGSPRAPGR
jgi:hypothetical protein